MTWTHVDELEAIEMPDGFVWRPIRRHFGIRAFGVNAYTAQEAGGQIVEEHSESSLGHEEIYLVLRGRARFTVDGSDHELGPGQLVFLREPSLRRGAVALDGDTVVLALGGKPGEPHVVSAWEAMFAAVPAVEPRRLGRGDRHSRSRRSPSGPSIRRCCTTSPASSRSPAGTSTRSSICERAIELEPKWAENARSDPDFASIRAEPGFPA